MTRKDVIKRLRTWKISCEKARKEYSRDETVFKSDIVALRKAIKYAEEYRNPLELVFLGIAIGITVSIALVWVVGLWKF